MTESVKEIKARVRKAQSRYPGNLMHVEGILLSERGYVSRVPRREGVVMLMSGGLDSSVMAQKVIEDFEARVYPLFIKRGSRNEKFEEKAFDFFADFYSRRFPGKFMAPKKLEYEIPPRDLKENFPKALAETVGHPMRNSTMQNLAVMYAVSLQTRGFDVKTIYSASVADDNTEPELGLLSLRAQTLSTCFQTGDWQWQITSPFIDPYLLEGEKPASKADIIQYAMAKFIPLDKTRTCFSSEETADGTCHACLKREAAFKHLGMADPLKYKDRSKKHG